MDNYISKLTEEERKNNLNNAFAISLGSDETPSDTVINLVQQYVDGKIELEEVQRLTIERFKNNG